MQADSPFGRYGGHLRKLSPLYIASWGAGLIRSALTAGVALAVNIAIYVWIYRKFDVNRGSGVLLRSSCGVVHRADSIIHLALNVISTLILGASNYCMQGLTAPTRDEVDKLHAKTKWADIGIQSMRNLRVIDWKRELGWALLGITSVPFHLV